MMKPTLVASALSSDVQKPSTANSSVSIIIPFYNQPLYIADAVESALAQTHRDVEILVIDDGSPTPATDVLAPNERVRIIRTENQGVSAARNTGFTESRGAYIIFLDSDDRLLPTAAEAHLAALHARPDGSLCFGARRVIDRAGTEISPPHVCRPRKDYFSLLLEGNMIGNPGSTMMRRSALSQAGLFNPSLRMAEDYELYFRLAATGPIVRHTSCVMEYRMHSEGVSTDNSAMMAATLHVIDALRDSGKLTPEQQRILLFGRNRWIHAFTPQPTLRYKLKTMLYSARAMASVPFPAQFRKGIDLP